MNVSNIWDYSTRGRTEANRCLGMPNMNATVAEYNLNHHSIASFPRMASEKCNDKFAVTQTDTPHSSGVRVVDSRQPTHTRATTSTTIVCSREWVCRCVCGFPRSLAYLSGARLVLCALFCVIVIFTTIPATCILFFCARRDKLAGHRRHYSLPTALSLRTYFDRRAAGCSTACVRAGELACSRHTRVVHKWVWYF